MSFLRKLESLPIARLIELSLNSSLAAVLESMAKRELSLEDFARLISPAAIGITCAKDLIRRPSARDLGLTDSRPGARPI